MGHQLETRDWLARDILLLSLGGARTVHLCSGGREAYLEACHSRSESPFVLQCRTWRRNVTQRPKNKEKQSSSGQRSSKEKSVYSKRKGVSIDRAQGIRRAGSQTGLSRACGSWPFQMWKLQEEQLTRLKSCLLNSITFSPQPPKMHTTPSNICQQPHSGKDQKSTNYLVLKYSYGSKSDEILMQKKKY